MRGSARFCLFLGLAVLAGCGGAPPDFVTERGVEVHLNGFLTLDTTAAAEMDASALFIWHHFHSEANYQRGIDCLRGVEVFLTAHSFDCGGVDALGCQRGKTITMEAPQPGPQGVWRSSYRHELMHRLDGCAVGDPDPDHRSGEWHYVLSPPVNSFP